jgi:hypothetical protein
MIMKLKVVYPLGVSMDPEEGIPGFLRSLLIRTNFVANTRNYLGWRGLKPSFKNGEAWTCRIKDKPGVYGIYFKEFTNDASWLTGKFSLSYFPQPDEDIVEFFSVAAGAHTQLPDYITQVREFLCYPGFARLFEVADIYFSFSISEDALLLTLRAPEVLKTICVDGIEVENEGQSFYLVDPGGIDSNLPAFDLALPFYEVLAATLTYNLSQAPSVFGQLKRIEKSTGIPKNITAAESVNVEMNLGYGDADFQSHLNPKQA